MKRSGTVLNSRHESRTAMKESVTIRIAIRSITAEIPQEQSVHQNHREPNEQDGTKLQHHTNARNRRNRGQITKPQKPQGKPVRRKSMRLLQTHHQKLRRLLASLSPLTLTETRERAIKVRRGGGNYLLEKARWRAFRSVLETWRETEEREAAATASEICLPRAF